MTNLEIKGKSMQFPIFMPDATYGVIRSLDATDLMNSKVEGLVTNTYHLLTQPGATLLKDAGGLKGFMNWDGFLISDSGGFQLLSLVHNDSEFGNVSDNGVVFYKKQGGKKNKYVFTPEKSILTQFRIGSDIMIAFDDCPRENCTVAENEASVERTIEWAKRCKIQFDKEIEQRKLDDTNRPLLFGVIQGGNDKQMREKCAAGLMDLGFDGFGFGGWPLDSEGSLNTEILQHTADLMPDNLPKYALGIGNPQAIVECYKMGYNIFDCVLPTRDGRHARLYILNENLTAENILDSTKVHTFMHIKEERYVRDFTAIDDKCDCRTCQTTTRAYLNHLFNIGDQLAGRLATIHNIRTYTRLIELLRGING